MMQPLEVVFELEGTGVVWDMHEPHHLDGLMSWAWRVASGLSMDCDCACLSAAEPV